MPDKPTAQEVESSEDPGTEVPSSNFESAPNIVATSVQAIQQLAPVYGQLGLAGFLTVAGTALILLTVALSFATGTANAGNWGGITIWEEVLFMAVAVFLITAGVVFLHSLNAAKAAIQRFALEQGHDQNRWVHEETMAKLAIRGSQPAVSKPPDQDQSSELSNG